MKRTTIKILALTIAATLTAGGALAGQRGGAPYGGQNFDFARVTHVQPIFQTVQVPTQQEVCWREPTHYRAGHNNPAGAIGGAIIGGAIGNRFGGGNGRKAATLAGVLLGAAVGNELANGRQHGQRGYPGHQQRCEVRTEYVNEQRIVAYDVEYEYFGQRFTTQLDHDPGPRMRVAVSVVPAP